MTRLLLLMSMLLVPVSSQQENMSQPLENQFAIAYNHWITLHGHNYQKDLLDANEVRAWKETRQLWKQLDHTIQY